MVTAVSKGNITCWKKCSFFRHLSPVSVQRYPDFSAIAVMTPAKIIKKPVMLTPALVGRISKTKPEISKTKPEIRSTADTITSLAERTLMNVISIRIYHFKVGNDVIVIFGNKSFRCHLCNLSPNAEAM